MPFAVTYSGGRIERHKFDTYVRLLSKSGIDWTDTLRISEPKAPNLNVNVWQDREDAQSFCSWLKKETHDNKWYVQDVDKSAFISRGPLMPVIIYLTRQSLGCTYTLHPHSRSAILQRYSQAPLASSVTIEYGKKPNPESTNGQLWNNIAMTLTGLSLEQLSDLGGYRIFDLEEECFIHNSVTDSIE